MVLTTQVFATPESLQFGQLMHSLVRYHNAQALIKSGVEILGKKVPAARLIVLCA